MAKRYVMTPARRAALKRAQAISAQKRKGRGKATASVKKSGKVGKHFKKHGKTYAKIGVALAAAQLGRAIGYYGTRAAVKQYRASTAGKRVQTPTTVIKRYKSPRKGAPRSNDFLAAGYRFGYHANLKAYRASKARRAARST